METDDMGDILNQYVVPVFNPVKEFDNQGYHLGTIILKSETQQFYISNFSENTGILKRKDVVLVVSANNEGNQNTQNLKVGNEKELKLIPQNSILVQDDIAITMAVDQDMILKLVKIQLSE